MVRAFRMLDRMILSLELSEACRTFVPKTENFIIRKIKINFQACTKSYIPIQELRSGEKIKTKGQKQTVNRKANMRKRESKQQNTDVWLFRKKTRQFAQNTLDHTNKLEILC